MTYMKYIPEFYILESMESCPEFIALDSDEQVKIQNDVMHYQEYIINAVNTAYKLFIEPHDNKNVIFSKTWGK